MLARFLLTTAATAALGAALAGAGALAAAGGAAALGAEAGSAGASEVAAAAELPVGPQVAPPAWATWHSRACKADIDGDGLLDRVLVGGRRFELRIAGEQGLELAFCSSDDWLVSDGHVADIDGNGLPEVVLLVWRAADFGSSRPFWVEKPAGSEEHTQHIFVLGWQGGTLRPRWMSSQTGVDIAAMAVDSEGALTLTDRAGMCTRWRWGSWGFGLEDEASEPVDQAAVLVAGDVIGHEALLAAARDGAGGFDFGPVFAPVERLLVEADLAIAGQETPFVSDPGLYGGYPYFGTLTALGEALVDAGVDVVLGASNHMLDRGERGVADTLAFWGERPEVALLGVREVEGAGALGGDDRGDDAGGGAGDRGGDRGGDPGGGAGFSPVVVEAAGFRIALFNATYGTNGQALLEDSAFEVDTLEMEALGAAAPAGSVAGELDAGPTSPRLDELLTQVKAARTRDDVDLVICCMHMGPEYGDEPSEAQREVVQRLAEAGADAVLCSHGHEALGWELLARSDGETCAVAWGLGNFAAVQDDLACMLGVCARLTVERDASERARVADVELVPMVIHVGREGGAEVYPLADYTDELASEHYLGSQGQPVTVAGLWELYAERTAMG